MKTKKFMRKKLGATVASVAMALVLVVGFSLTPAAQVSAKAAPHLAKSTDNTVWDITSSYEKTVPFDKSTYDAAGLFDAEITPIDITNGAQNVTLQDDEGIYVMFTSSTAGDYMLTFQEFSALIMAFDINTEEYEVRDTEWYDGEYWQHRTTMVFTLSANTPYLFYILPYEPTDMGSNPETLTLAMEKAEGDVDKIEIVDPGYTMDCYNLLDASDFSYKVTASGQYLGTFSYSEVCMSGYDIGVNIYGDYICFNNEEVMRAVDTTVIADYQDCESSIVVEISSITENHRANGVTASDVDDHYFEVYESQGDGTGYSFLITASQTGYYYWIDYEDISIDDAFSTYSAVMLDDQNNIVQFNEETSTWPLVAGRDYAFCLYREFAPNVSSFAFAFYKDVDSIYSDVSKFAWYHDAVTYVTGRGAMTGYGGTDLFGAADNIQRQDFLVMLARLEGVDLENYKYDSEFPDVPSGSYYQAAINWGYENGIVTGYENGYFGVGDEITREQLVAFLYRYANYCYVDTSVSLTETQISRQYSDYKYVSDWAKDYVIWAIDKGVISGQGGTYIAPGGSALRCEVAQIIYNIFENDII